MPSPLRRDILSLSLAFTAAACVLPTDLGDPPAPTETTGVATQPTSSPGSDTADEPTGVAEQLTGAAQKGPFILGSKIGVSPLSAAGNPLGSYFESKTDNDAGEFTIADVPAGPAALAAEGFYFDEVRDELSAAPLTLRALHRVTAGTSTVHVHPLTHIAEPRARALMAGGLDVDAALVQAEAEAVVALGVGPPGFTLSGSAGAASVTGPDSDDNAYVFAVGAVFAAVGASGDPNAPEAELQLALNAAAMALADGGGLSAEQLAALAAAEAELDAAAVQAALDARLAVLGLPPAPDIRRALDQDFDGLANLDDNCPHTANPNQSDGDGDGIGDACESCEGSADDSDDDGVQDACDNCPEDPNPLVTIPNQPMEMWQPDGDGDGLGDACDACPQIAGLGATPGENCCDPRGKNLCTGLDPGDNLPYICFPEPSGLRFTCMRRGLTGCFQTYATKCYDCYTDTPCVPPGALTLSDACNPPFTPCDGELVSRWCTVGQDAACDAGNECLTWWKPGEAPPGLESLGVCVIAGGGTCQGEVGRECAHWEEF